jgi:hypothetical protein
MPENAGGLDPREEARPRRRRPLKTEPGDFMPVLTTQLNPRSADFKANADAMRLLIDDLNAQLERIALGGGEAARASTRPAASCCRASACGAAAGPRHAFSGDRAAGWAQPL